MAIELLAGFLLVLGFGLVSRAIYLEYKSRTSLYLKGSVEEALAAFKKNTDPLLLLLDPPHDCDDAVTALKDLKNHYVKLLKRANQTPENSEDRQRIFDQGLTPVLDKISYASTARECSKNLRFKKAFDQFIQTIQKQN